MSAADIGDTGFGKPEIANLALLDEFGNGSSDVLHRDSRIDAVLVDEIDVVGGKTLERALDGAANGLRPAVALGADLLAILQAKAEFGGERHLVAATLQRTAEQFFIPVGAVDLCRVEKGAAELDGAV